MMSWLCYVELRLGLEIITDVHHWVEMLSEWIQKKYENGCVRYMDYRYVTSAGT